MALVKYTKMLSIKDVCPGRLLRVIAETVTVNLNPYPLDWRDISDVTLKRLNCGEIIMVLEPPKKHGSWFHQIKALSGDRVCYLLFGTIDDNSYSSDIDDEFELVV